jgi:signal transduction histidine kinase/CheY-like chemotaxis protein
MKPEIVFGLENAAWPALLVNSSGVILLANSAAKSVFGAALNASPAQFAAIWSPENSGNAADFLKQPAGLGILKFKTAAGHSLEFSASACEFNREGNHWFVLQLLPAPAGRMVAAVPDEKVVPPMTGDAALKQKLECVLQLARSVSLDFNNALTGVLAHTSLLLGKAEPDHPWRHSLIEVEKSAARAAEIASDLALFSRQDKEPQRAPEGNLNEVTARCVEFFQKAHGARLDFRVTLERALYAARFDEAKVQQALTKILANAVESFRMSDTGTISVQTRNVELTEPTQDLNVRLTTGVYVCVEISDHGAGIEPETLPHIFEPFFTTKHPPHRGLGLALVYGIVTNHGGGIAISSEPRQGTSARIYWPAEKKLIFTGAIPDKDLHGTGTILVVDDENILLTMSDTILSEFGYKVLTANSAQKALAILSQPKTKVDLIITDLVMPEMGGRELIECVRKTNLDLPIICTSGYVLPKEKQNGADYLKKPFTAEELLQKVKSALNGIR